MRRKIINRWVEYKDPIDLLDRPNNVKVGLCWYQKSEGLKWSYDITDHIMVELDMVITLANLTFDVETDTQVMRKSLTTF
jgi:hypothetical protein